MKNRKSIIWKCSNEQFKNWVKESISMSQLLRYFGLENKGNNFVSCKLRIKELNLDISHFLNRKDSSRFHISLTKEEALKKFSENSSTDRGTIKKYIVKFKLFDYKCNKCQNTGEWQNEKLSLQLEHKNGISNDNRLENLCFLCPNCHSQTSSFAGKRHKKFKIKPSKLNPRWRFEPKIKMRKFVRPSKEELEQKIRELPILSIAKFYGVNSDNTIRKWLKSYNIDWKNISPFSHKNKGI